MQIVWLAGALKKSLQQPDAGHALALDEITPYIRLLLSEVEEGRRQELASRINGLEESLISQMLRAADIYDATILFGLLEHPTVEQVAIALTKEAPAFEKSAQLVIDKLFMAIHRQAPAVMEAAATMIVANNEVSPHFEQAYARFKDMLMDEELLSALFPKARA